jgi:hypothetical protein
MFAMVKLIVNIMTDGSAIVKVYQDYGQAQEDGFK